MSTGAKAVVVIPTYNEIENINAIVTRVLSIERNFHLLIIDDNSPDGTANAVKEMQTKWDGRLHLMQRAGKLGLGTAYIAGFKWAIEHNYDYVFEMDADFSHNPDDLPRLFDACVVEGADMSIGSRYCNGVNVVNWPMQRVLLSYYASAYVRVVTGMPVRDTTAGFKCYSVKVLKAIDLDKIKFKGYAFQIEMKFTAWKLGFKIKEVSIIFQDRTFGVSKMNKSIVREAIFGVLKLKIGSWFKKYKPKN